MKHLNILAWSLFTTASFPCDPNRTPHLVHLRGVFFSVPFFFGGGGGYHSLPDATPDSVSLSCFWGPASLHLYSPAAALASLALERYGVSLITNWTTEDTQFHRSPQTGAGGEGNTAPHTHKCVINPASYHMPPQFMSVLNSCLNIVIILEWAQ